jgi:hypothetical protein
MRQDLALALKEAQQEDGSFENFSAPLETELWQGARTHKTTFFAAVIALALAEVELAEAETVRQRAVDFLLGQVGSNWSFNYWAKGTAEAQALPYPDDWDDTSLALAAISTLRPDALGGEAMAKLVTQLTNTEVQEGGPYRTWLVGSEAAPEWLDVDLAVNANIGHLLRLHGVELPNLAGLVEESLAKGKIASRYYPDSLPVLYFTSRFYKGRARDDLLALVRQELRSALTRGNTQGVAMALTAAVNFGEPAEQLSQAIGWLNRRSAEAVLTPLPFCLDPMFERRQHAAGAGALAAALTLEAGAKFDRALRASRQVQRPSEDDAVHREIVAIVDRQFASLGKEIGEGWPALRERVFRHDQRRQITLLPWWFSQALGESSTGREATIELGAASLYGWVAYTIYDDFLDAEGAPALLPMANVALRELTYIYSRDPGEARLLKRLLNLMESANAWEVAHARLGKQIELLTVAAPDFGDFKRLADRSMGHALGCLTVMLRAGFEDGMSEMASLERFFQHFIIARQLGDDAHDWREDLKRGQINAVASRLVARTARRGKSVAEYYARLEREFWTEVVLEVCDLIDSQLELARSALRECAFLEKPEVLARLLEPVESMVATSRREQKRTIDFLTEYATDGPANPHKLNR